MFKPSLSHTLLYTFIDQRSRLHREIIRRRHVTQYKSVQCRQSLPLPPPFSLCILSNPLQRLTSYFLTSRNRATPHVFPNHFLNRKMTFSSSIYDRVPFQLIIFERLQRKILILISYVYRYVIKINRTNIYSSVEHLSSILNIETNVKIIYAKDRDF